MPLKISIKAQVQRDPNAKFDQYLFENGKDFSFKLRNLEDFSCKNATETDVDLLTIICAATCVDRKAKRKLRYKWSRNINVSIPVYDPLKWNDENVATKLKKLLHTLTGDNWQFDFTKRSERVIGWEYLTEPPEGNFELIPYSDGLDSFALGCTLDGLGKTRQLRVTSWGRDLECNNKHKCQDGGKRIPIPISIADRTHSELSYRTRSFKFLVLAALVAKWTNSPTVYVPENGQGVFAPYFSPKGSEAIYWGSHPLFSAALSDLIRETLNHSVNFEHPHLWETKGEVLARINAEQSTILATKSCAASPTDKIRIDNKKVHCGLCSNCLLRRVSLHTAGITGNQEPYFWADLNAPDLNKMRPGNTDRSPSPNDPGMAFAAVLSMDNFARLNESRTFERDLAIHTKNLSKHKICSVDEGNTRIKRLVKAHQIEWDNFLDTLSPKSWIRSIVRK